MFKRSLRLLQENKATSAKKHPKILDYYTPNDHLVDRPEQVPYEMRGDYLPRQKINPYKKTPLHVTYHHHDFSSYVLPSRRESVYGMWNFEELFGVKRWRNDSPFIKEYIKVDNQVIMIVLLLLVLSWPFFWHRHRTLMRNWDDYLTSHYGKFTADDLL